MRRLHLIRKLVKKGFYMGWRIGAAVLACAVAALCLVGCAVRQPNGAEDFYSLYWDAETASAQEKEDEALREAARKMGTEPFPEIKNLEKELEEFNSRREQQRKKGEPVYGLEKYDILTYYNFRRYECETELLLSIQDDILENRQEELRERYEQADNEDLTNERRAVLERYVIEPEEFEEHPEEAEAALMRLEQMISEQGRPAEEELARDFGFPVAVSEIGLESGGISREDSFSAALLQLAWETGPDGVFRYMLSEGSSYQGLYYVILAETGERPDFEQAAAGIAMDYAAEELERMRIAP